MNRCTIVLGLVALVVAQACSTATPPMQSSTPQRQSSVPSTAPAESRLTKGSKTSSEAVKAAAHQENAVRGSNNETRQTTAKTAGSATEKRPRAQAQNELERRSMPTGSPTGMRVGQTSEERRARLERELNTSLSKFDEQLLRERKLLNAAVLGGQPHVASGTTLGTAGTGSQGASGSSANSSASGPGFTPEGPAAATQPINVGSHPSGAPPANIPSGQDDDIVARQLREAAENETDPTLREKLWQEYRKYKNATASQTEPLSSP